MKEIEEDEKLKVVEGQWRCYKCPECGAIVGSQWTPGCCGNCQTMVYWILLTCTYPDCECS